MAETDIYNSILSLEANELLRFLLERDNLSLDGVVDEMRKSRTQQIIDNHPYKIFEGKDGRWHTTFKDDSYSSGRRHIAKATYDKLLVAIIEHYEKENENTNPNSITLEALYPQWLEYKKLHSNSDSYIYRITLEWNKYYKGTDIIKVPIVSLTKLQLDSWAHKLIKDNRMSKKQYFNTTVIMRQMMIYALDLEIIKDNPFSRVKVDGKRMFRRISKPASETQVFTNAEEDALHKIAWEDFNSKRHHKHQLIPLVVMFLFQTGLRISEVCALRYEDIEGDQLHIQRMFSNFENKVKDCTKGCFGDRYVPLTEDAIMLIATAKNRQIEEGVSSDGYIFSMTDKQVPYSELRKTFRRYCKEADILERSSHKVRKTVISKLFDDSVNIDTIRQMMGHLDERTTLGSYCFDRKEKSERRAQISKSLSRSARPAS